MFVEALAFAAELHNGQRRKGSDIPYVAHLLSVTALVLEAGGSERQAIAAMLHDAIEDRPHGGRTAEEIRQRFGDEVLRIVLACSDQAAGTAERGAATWRERKTRYLAHLPSLAPEALLVTLADKVHNAQAIAGDGRLVGEAVWGRFNAGKDEQLWYYRGLRDGLRVALEGHGVPAEDRRWALYGAFEAAVGEMERLAGGGTGPGARTTA